MSCEIRSTGAVGELGRREGRRGGPRDRRDTSPASDHRYVLSDRTAIEQKL